MFVVSLLIFFFGDPLTSNNTLHYISYTVFEKKIQINQSEKKSSKKKISLDSYVKLCPEVAAILTFKSKWKTQAF